MNNSNGQVEFKRLPVVRIQHYRDGLFFVEYESCKAVIADDVAIAETASNFKEFKENFVKFLRGRKIKSFGEDSELIYNEGDVIYENRKHYEEVQAKLNSMYSALSSL